MERGTYYDLILSTSLLAPQLKVSTVYQNLDIIELPQLKEAFVAAQGSSAILDHFVAYVEGATDTSLHLGPRR